MSEQTAETAATGAEASTEQQQQEQRESEVKPTETVDFWKQKAREQEKRAKENAAAAKRLRELEDAQKTESEKAADRVAKAEAEVAELPAKVSAALRDHLVSLHEIETEDADLFLTATDPELLLKQVNRLLSQSDTRRKKGPVVPGEGHTPDPPKADEMRDFTRQLFNRPD